MLLISVGCKKIAYIGGSEVLKINKQRAQGFKDALANNNIELDDDHMMYSRFDRESILTAARSLLYSPDFPDGILTFSDQIAISVLLAAKEKGIAIPEKLSLGFNNKPIDELLEPSLTSINQPGYRMGEESAQLHLKQLTNFNNVYEKRILKSFLVVCNSTNKNRHSKSLNQY